MTLYEHMQRVSNPASFKLIEQTRDLLIARMQDEAREIDIEIGPIQSEVTLAGGRGLFVRCFAEITDAKGREVVTP